jgi:hypothetical protein
MEHDTLTQEFIDSMMVHTPKNNRTKTLGYISKYLP